MRQVLASTLVVVEAGSLLHFAWPWSGRNPLVGVFAATSESTWEHLKLAFWPALLLALPQRRVYRRPPGWLPAAAIRCLAPPALIVALFYGGTRRSPAGTTWPPTSGRSSWPCSSASFWDMP